MMNMTLKQQKKIAIAQINTKTGSLTENSKKVEYYIQKAQKLNIETLIFPKDIILGVNLKSLKLDKILCEKAEKLKQDLKNRYKNIEIVFDDEKSENMTINNIPQRYCFKNTNSLMKDSKTKNRLNIFANAVGVYDEKIYEGRSFAFYNGKLIALGKFLEEDLVLLDFEKDIQYKPLSFEEETFRVLSFGLKDYCEKTGFKKVVLGLSGGLDSAITAVLACNAIGAENVLGVTMPSKFSSEGSFNDSFKLAENLGMKCIEKPIKSLFDEFINCVQDGKIYNDLAEENIQPRIRALILMNYSNRENRLLLSTGNKSECSMGYCTLYGDTCGGLNLIADVFKTDLYKISNWVNLHYGREIIPNEILIKPPSAELRPDQKDEDSLPPYEVLDDILKRHIELEQSIDEISKNYDRDFVKEIIRKLNFNEFKRNQYTLFFEISKRTLGTDRNFPIMHKIEN